MESKDFNFVEHFKKYSKQFKGMSMDEKKDHIKKTKNYPEFTKEDFMKLPFYGDINSSFKVKTGNIFRMMEGEPNSGDMTSFLELEIKKNDEINVICRACWIK